MFIKPVWDFYFVSWCIIVLEVAIRKWAKCGHEGLHMVSKNAERGCRIQAMIDWD